MPHQVVGPNRSPVVLVIDDDQNDRDLTVRFIKKHSPEVRVETCTSGFDGLDTIVGYMNGRPEELPSLVVLDLKMPGMNGDVLTSRLSSRKQTMKFPVVLFSSSALQEDVDRCMETGVRSYVRKPVDYHEYDEAIRGVCASWLDSALTPKTN